MKVESCGAEYGPVLSASEHSNDLLSFIKGGEFHGQLSACQFLQQNSAPWSWLNRLITHDHVLTERNCRRRQFDLMLLKASEKSEIRKDSCYPSKSRIYLP